MYIVTFLLVCFTSKRLYSVQEAVMHCGNEPFWTSVCLLANKDEIHNTVHNNNTK